MPARIIDRFIIEKYISAREGGEFRAREPILRSVEADCGDLLGRDHPAERSISLNLDGEEVAASV